MPNPTYLGDSVYCLYDGYSYILFLNNGERSLTNEILQKSPIYCEPEVLQALITFYTNTQQNKPTT